MKKTVLFSIMLLSFHVTVFAQTAFDSYKAKRDSAFQAFEKKRQTAYDSYNAKRDSAFAAYIENRWQTYLKVPGVSLPQSPKSLTKNTIVIPKINADENPDVAIIDALSNEGISQEQSVKIALEIIDSLGIDAIREGQVIGIASELTNPAKPVVVTYKVDSIETVALLQAKDNRYVYTESREKVKEIFTTYKGTVGDPISRNILPTLNAMANGTAKQGTPFSALVKKDGTGTDKIVAIDYNGVKVFSFSEGRSSALNVFYTSNGAAVIKSKYRFPLSGAYRKTSGFGIRIDPFTKQRKVHNGIDYAGMPSGSSVYTVADGEVTESAFDRLNGNYVVVKHRDGLTSYYLHLKENGIRKGTNVAAGQVIGKVGSTGRSNGPHLHLGIKKNNEWQNPEKILGTIGAPQLSGDRLQTFNTQVKEYSALFSL